MDIESLPEPGREGKEGRKEGGRNGKRK